MFFLNTAVSTAVLIQSVLCKLYTFTMLISNICEVQFICDRKRSPQAGWGKVAVLQVGLS